MARKYQRGNLTLKPRANGPDVWEFRWRDAKGTQCSRLLGTVEQYPTDREAQSAADAVRLEINSESQRVVPVTVATLIERYLSDEIEMPRLAFATQRSYKAFLNNWVRPKWGTYVLDQVRAVAVEHWLRGWNSRQSRSCIFAGLCTFFMSALPDGNSLTGIRLHT